MHSYSRLQECQGSLTPRLLLLLLRTALSCCSLKDRHATIDRRYRGLRQTDTRIAIECTPGRSGIPSSDVAIKRNHDSDLIEATLETPGLVGVDRFNLQEGKARMLFIIIELYCARVHRIWKSEPQQRIISVQKYIERILLHVFEKIKLKNWEISNVFFLC